MKIFLTLLLMLSYTTKAKASYVLDCEVKAKLMEINSKKPYQTEYFRDYDLGEVVELLVLSATNDRMESLKTECQNKLRGKTEIGKLRAPLPKEVKQGDVIKLRYVFSIPRSPQPQTGVTWEYRN
jgi:uncharacterized alpha-E superfamily protein